MALPVSALLALVMLCSSVSCSLGCELLWSHGNPETDTLLKQMGRISIWSCLKDRTDFRFPETLVDGNQVEKTQAIDVLHKMLQQTFNLFSTSDAAAAWDKTLRKRFLAVLDLQLDGLEPCLSEEKKVGQSSLGSENSSLAVKSYFEGISLYLKEKKYSLCAWEVVRVEIRNRLVLVNKLIGKLRK
ncbi:interferon alpha-2-like protein [Camelus ferus]|nr:interferon alpha-2-like protein [Camelus ferus]